MKKPNHTENKVFLTRAELINRVRTSVSYDRLPQMYEGMFDNLLPFKQGTREFIDLSHRGKP
jgi:hypothetical protein